MGTQRNKIVKFCGQYLKVERFHDYCVNGLQVEGNPKVEKIITGVSISKKLIEEAIKRKAEMIIVHHGIFSKNIPSPPVFSGYFKERLKLILENDLNLCGFHIPLDANPLIGNNISLLKLLGLEKTGVLKHTEYGEIGFIGKLKKPMALKEFKKFIDKKLDTNCGIYGHGNGYAEKIGIIAGSAATELELVKNSGADTFLTGEIKESAVRAAEETGINFIQAGHYNTEKLGIQNLGDLIAKKFKVKVEFVDIPCEI